MSTIDQQFVEYIVKSLVGKPDAVSIDRTIDEKGVLLKLTVDNEDLGRVIGKRGSTAQSIRTLLRALGTKNDARYNLKIIDPLGGPPPRRDDNAAPVDDRPAEDSVPIADEPADTPSDEQTAAATSDEPEEEIVHETATAPEDEVPLPEPEPVGEPANQDTLADKTRKELAELDDLDI